MNNATNLSSEAEESHHLSAFVAFQGMDHHHQAAVAAAAAAWDQVRLHHGGQYPHIPHHQPSAPAAAGAVNPIQPSGSAAAVPPTSIAALGDAAAALQLGLPLPHATPTSMHSYFNSHHHAATHQDYLNRLHASTLEASANLRARNSRKRALSASPGYSDLELANLMRHSPTFLQSLNAAAASNASPSSSGSYGHLSGANSPVLQGLHQASSHLQQLQAHLLRTSPYLSPQNSFIHAASSYLNPPSAVALFGSQPNGKSEAENAGKDDTNVVSSTMEDVEAEKRKRKGKSKSRSANALVVQEASSSTGNDCNLDEDEKEFFETHCHWVNCDRDFDTQDLLVKHLNNDHVGSNKKSFICQWKNCAREEKPFKAQYMLVVHLRRHTGEKPHRCTFEACNKAYSRLENLKTHLRSHTGEKPYTCEFPGCSKAFSNASDRAKHQNRTHSNEKPYACKAPGCTKRYTDPSSLRKHVKTVHGADFYASKRHKGEDSDEQHKETRKMPQHNASRKRMHNSPSATTPGSGSPESSGIQATFNNSSSNDCLPISDNNVSTTNDSLLDEPDWDHNDADINMAVAAAMVGDDQEDVMSSRLANATNRLSGKRSLLPRSSSAGVSQQQQQQQQMQQVAGLSEINRSIEKMTLQHQEHKGSSKTTRRDSDWTSVSTEDQGYGSMRSEQANNSSRRCSELSTASQVSNVSTRAVVNSGWEASSRRSSSVETSNGSSQQNNQQGARIGQHLNRLHKKAQEHIHDGRQSVMSECNNPHPSSSPSSSALSGSYGGRRASDPVRVLDRNFGVGQARHRSGSYTGHQGPENNPGYQFPPQKSASSALYGQYNQGSAFTQQPVVPGAGQQQGAFAGFPNPGQNWPQFNGFHEGYEGHYGNYQNWSASQQQHWNNAAGWNYYNAQQQQQQQQPTGENSASYQRTLQYVQQCQQQSWSSANTSNPPPPPQ